RGTGRRLSPEPLGPLGQRRSGREAAVADDLERHALTDLRLCAGIERQREIRVGVDVDEAGRHHLAARVDHTVSRTRRPPLERDDTTGADAHVAVTARRAGTIDQGPAANQQIVHGPTFTGAAPARAPHQASGATTRARRTHSWWWPSPAVAPR